MTDDLSRLGESAAGDGVSGHLPVPRVDPVPGPPPLPPLPHQHLDLQMAYRSHHAGSCEYRTDKHIGLFTLLHLFSLYIDSTFLLSD